MACSLTMFSHTIGTDMKLKLSLHILPHAVCTAWGQHQASISQQILKELPKENSNSNRLPGMC